MSCVAQNRDTDYGGGISGVARVAETEPTARAGERGAAWCCGVSVSGGPAGKAIYPLVVSFRGPKLARQPCYRWLKDPINDREVDEAYRANASFDAHQDDPELGDFLPLFMMISAWSSTTTDANAISSFQHVRTSSGSPTSPSTRPVADGDPPPPE